MVKMSIPDVSCSPPENLPYTPSQDLPYSTNIFLELKKIVDPYRQDKGLEWTKLHFTVEGDHEVTEFLIRDVSKEGSKEIIRITRPYHPNNVKVFDDNYKDLGELLREKLTYLKEDYKSFKTP